jgi:hypothetical protein
MPSKKDVLEDPRAKFLLVGFLNTVAGFVIFTVLYMVLKDQISYLAILLITQVLAVMFSHSTQRILVWKSTGSYAFELVRFSGSYAAIAHCRRDPDVPSFDESICNRNDTHFNQLCSSEEIDF